MVRDARSRALLQEGSQTDERRWTSPTSSAQLKSSLADYEVPKHVEILKDLPRQDSGKIFKRRLYDPYWERAGRII